MILYWKHRSRAGPTGAVFLLRACRARLPERTNGPGRSGVSAGMSAAGRVTVF